MGLVGSRASVTQLADELGDIVICVDLIAMDTGIDLWPATATKFNKTSEQRGLATRLGFSKAARDVLAERQRQIVTKAGRQSTTTGTHGNWRRAPPLIASRVCPGIRTQLTPVQYSPVCGLRTNSSGNPECRARMLVKAGALILAEIERIDPRRCKERRTMKPLNLIKEAQQRAREPIVIEAVRGPTFSSTSAATMSARHARTAAESSPLSRSRVRWLEREVRS